jgi:3-isopropylmalate dehydrogenase
VLIVRELLGGLYFGEPRGLEPTAPDPHSPTVADETVAFNTMRYRTAEIERVGRVAFEQALGRRRRLTSVDKANVLETSQLWRRTVDRIAGDYPQVAVEHMYVDACAMRLVSDPRRFDVIVTENLFGDILSDEASVIAGSLGMLASASLGGRVDLYEPVHGSAPDIAGSGQANPFGAIASVALLLRHTAGSETEAACVEESVRRVLAAGCRTPDLCREGGEEAASTTEAGERVAEILIDVAGGVATAASPDAGGAGS